MTDEMKPCPFCQSLDVSVETTWRGLCYAVKCVCHAEGPARDTKAEAISTWNNRPARKEGEAEWRYSINYGPDGEANYANVFASDGILVGNLRTHHAMAIVAQMNARAILSSDSGEQAKHYDLATYDRWQLWREQDHEDSAVISRTEIISLLLLAKRGRTQSADYARGWKEGCLKLANALDTLEFPVEAAELAREYAIRALPDPVSPTNGKEGK
jgi:Lar family restriction alleviation protein